MVGMDSDIYIVILGHQMYMVRQRDCAYDAVVHIRPRRVRAAAGRYLNDTVRLGCGKPFQHGVDCLHIGYIERRDRRNGLPKRFSAFA